MLTPLVLVVSTRPSVFMNEDQADFTDIASISAVEGRNWRHGDIEDLIKQVACIKHHKWNTMMIKRIYFGSVDLCASPLHKC